MELEDIIEIAKEANCIPRKDPRYWNDVQVFATPEVLERFARAVYKRGAADRKEKDAQIAESWDNGSSATVAHSIARCIRAQGDDA